MPEITPIALSGLTTLRCGGTPVRMVEARTRDELVDALRDAWDDGEVLALGGGSNLLAGDEPFDGTVVLVRTSGIRELPSPREGVVRLQIDAGHEWDAVVRYAVDAGLSGVEALSGIPGTAGATPVQNVGAYGQEIAQTLVEVELIDEADGAVHRVPAADLALGLRTSVLKHHYGSHPVRPAVVLSITLDLPVAGPAPRRVPGGQLRSALHLADDEQLSLAEIRGRVLDIRRGKGMVLDDPDADTHSAGSFFQNPVLPAAAAAALPDGCPRYPVRPVDEPDDRVMPLSEYIDVDPIVAPAAPDVKVSAAWLIEHAGMRRGFHLPRSRAGLSTKHALALTNRGGATAAELAELARYVRIRVMAEYGIELQPEPVLIGVTL